jgi:DNA polymerase III subunit epsilon
MREIVLDTETTGFDPAQGHRVVEIGCLELVNHVATGKTFHKYVNPERDMPAEAFAVHGLGEDFLRGQPLFGDIVDDFLAFLGDAPIIAHNAEFDFRFVNAELVRCGQAKVPYDRAIDTVTMARSKFPGAPASLDALFKRFMIDNGSRTLHGALLDAQLLAEVYLELIGGRQPDLALAANADDDNASGQDIVHRPARPHAASRAELAAHSEFLKKITDPLWLR